jgi:hypothetical protein
VTKRICKSQKALWHNDFLYFAQGYVVLQRRCRMWQREEVTEKATSGKGKTVGGKGGTQLDGIR